MRDCREQRQKITMIINQIKTLNFFFDVENVGHHYCVTLTSRFHYFSLLNGSADTNPSFLGHKIIKHNLNTINISRRRNAFTYKLFSFECFLQIYVIYNTYFVGLRIVDFKIHPQYIFAMCNVYLGKEENQQFLSKEKYSGSHLNRYL